MAVQRDNEGRKDRRLEARVNAAQKLLMERAAALRGQTLTQFVLDSAVRSAEETIEQNDIITLSARDSLIFAEALLAPALPNRHLQEALADYKRSVKSS